MTSKYDKKPQFSKFSGRKQSHLKVFRNLMREASEKCQNNEWEEALHISKEALKLHPFSMQCRLNIQRLTYVVENLSQFGSLRYSVESGKSSSDDLHKKEEYIDSQARGRANCPNLVDGFPILDELKGELNSISKVRIEREKSTHRNQSQMISRQDDNTVNEHAESISLWEKRKAMLEDYMRKLRDCMDETVTCYEMIKGNFDKRGADHKEVEIQKSERLTSPNANNSRSPPITPRRPRLSLI